MPTAEGGMVSESNVMESWPTAHLMIEGKTPGLSVWPLRTVNPWQEHLAVLALLPY